MNQKVTWVVEPELFEGHFDELKKLSKELGFGLVATDVTLEGPLPVAANPVIVHGSLQLMRKVRQEAPQWAPGCVCNIDDFLYSNYAPYLRKVLLNPEWEVTDVVTLIEQARTSQLKPCFVRPDRGDKPFRGTVINGDPVIWLAQCKSFERDAGGNVSAIVAPLKEVKAEYRCIVFPDYIVSCRYIKDDCLSLEKDAPSDVEHFAWSAATVLWGIRGTGPRVMKDNALTVDVAETPEGLKIVELNAFSTSDWYACDTGKIVSAAESFLL